MGIDASDLIIVDGLRLLRAFVKIADAADRDKLIKLATELARERPGIEGPVRPAALDFSFGHSAPIPDPAFPPRA
jgi:hypothetical protein